MLVECLAKDAINGLTLTDAEAITILKKHFGKSAEDNIKAYGNAFECQSSYT